MEISHHGQCMANRALSSLSKKDKQEGTKSAVLVGL